MNQLQRVFEYEGKSLRTALVDGQSWFVAKDVCDILELGNVAQAVSRLDEDEKDVISNDTPGGKQELVHINEPGLYSLILGSRKREARKFKRWVTHEVLPSIRQYGLYATDDVVNQIIADPDFGIQLLTNYKEEREGRLQAERTNAILMHVTKTYTATEIAKELGFRSATALNRDLAERRIQFKQNKTWVLYSDYANRGYTEIKQEVLDNGKVIYHRRWTQLGREFLLNLYNEEASA
mgnify:CR=1 FL=1